MAKQVKDVRGIEKLERERDRQQKRAERLAKRREAREQQQRPKPDERAGKGAQMGQER